LNASIVAAGPEHIHEIAALAGVVWRRHYRGIISDAQIDYMLDRMYDPRVMEGEMRSGVTYERLLIDGELRGFACYGPASTPGELKLHKLYIHPGSQRKGLGSQLLARVEGVARERGFGSVILTVNKQNQNAIAAYVKNGFRIRDAVVVDIGNDFVMDDYVMVKDL
jgi:ribosomal protein S18 acetylase RimI-like enzyme